MLPFSGLKFSPDAVTAKKLFPFKTAMSVALSQEIFLSFHPVLGLDLKVIWKI